MCGFDREVTALGLAPFSGTGVQRCRWRRAALTSGPPSLIVPGLPGPVDGPTLFPKDYEAIGMVSSTRQTERRRAMNKSRNGRANKKARVRAGTPAFPVHPEGYSSSAPDAKKAKE